MTLDSSAGTGTDLHITSLSDLAAIANQEHQAVQSALDDAVRALNSGAQHGIRAGEALTAARNLVGVGGWRTWCRNNIRYSEETIKRYQRLAHYRPAIEQWIAGGGNGKFDDAIEQLRGLPAFIDVRTDEKPAEVKERAKKLHAQGMSYHEIATLLGTYYTTVRGWMEPEYTRAKRRRARRAQKRRKEAQKALAQKERDVTVRRAGGAMAEIYALLRRSSAETDRAMVASESETERELLRKAMGRIHAAEDAIVEALKLSRGSQGSA